MKDALEGSPTMLERLRAVCDLRVADVRERAGRHEYDGRVQDLSPSGVARALARLGGARIDDPLEDAHLGAFETAARVAFGELRVHQWNPRPHLENLDLGVYERDYAPAGERRLARAGHVSAWPDAVAAAVEALDAVPRQVAAALLPAVRGLAAQLAPDPAEESAARAALARFVAHLESAAARGPRDAALGGGALAALLGAGESVRVDLGALADEAERDRSRLHDMLAEACGRLFPDLSVDQAVTELLADHPDADGVLAEAQAISEETIAFTRSRGIVADVDGECRIAPALESRRWATAMLDWAAPGEPDGASWFRITPPDPAWDPSAQEEWLQAYSRATLPATTVHEVAPGHFAHGRLLRRLDSDVRRTLQSPAFIEGWAHYAEEMALEEGFRAGDARFAAGVALKALLRTTRLLVSIGFHTGAMDMHEAVRRFVADAHLRPAVARAEAARATFDPTYGRYTWGKLRLRALRDDVRRAAAGGWSLSAFHAAVLALGAPPLGLLDRAVTAEALTEPAPPRPRPPGMADLSALLAVPQVRAEGFTADAATMLVTSDAAGVAQAWTVPLPRPGIGGAVQPPRPGRARAIATGSEHVRSVTGSPVDASLAVVAVDSGGNERTQLRAVGLGDGDVRDLAADPRVVHRRGPFDPSGRWLYFCSNARDGVDFDLWRVPSAGGAAQCVCRLKGSNSATDVSSSGNRVLVVHERSTMDSDVLVVDVQARRVAEVLGSGGPRTLRHLDPCFDDRGRVFLRSDRGGDWLAVWRVDLDTGRWQSLPFATADVDHLAVAGPSGAIAVNDDGYSRLHLFDTDALTVSPRVPLPDGVVSDLSWDQAGRRLAFTLAAPGRPPQAWLLDQGRPSRGSIPTGLSCRRVHGGDEAGILARAVAPQRTTCPSFDSRDIPLLVYRPPGVPRPPVVMCVHGGPASQERPEYAPDYQHLLARGVAVVAPNVRGSTGYGRRYAEADDRGLRADAIADLGAVREWIDDQADLDGDRVAIMGRSYGGYMVLSALVSYPERFAAGVDIVGMADLETFLERTGAYRRAHREVEYGSLSHDRALLKRLSPLGNAGRIRAPILVIHGENDPRVPVGEARSIVAAVRERGGLAQLLVFDDEGHTIARRHNLITASRATVAFLLTHLRA